MSPEFRNRVLAALPAERPGLRPHEVHKRIDFGSLDYTRHVISELVDEGLVVHEGPLGGRRYRRREVSSASVQS